jgi:hypothetical protein
MHMQVAVGFMVYGLPQSSTQRLRNEFMITTGKAVDRIAAE